MEISLILITKTDIVFIIYDRYLELWLNFKIPQYFYHLFHVHRLTHKKSNFCWPLKMNSKILQEKIKELQEEETEMRLLKRCEKNLDCDEEKERVVSTSQSTVSLRHYDQVISQWFSQSSIFNGPSSLFVIYVALDVLRIYKHQSICA